MESLFLPALVAGKAEKMASVVHIFMHVHAGNDRRSAFLDTDKVNREKQHDAEKQPGNQLLIGMGTVTETGFESGVKTFSDMFLVSLGSCVR